MGAGAERRGDDLIALLAYGALAAVGMIAGDLPAVIGDLRGALGTTGARVPPAIAIVAATSLVATAACASLVRRQRLRVPSLLVALAALPGAVGAILASWRVAPAAEAAEAFRPALEARAHALAGVAAVEAVGLWATALALVVAALGFALGTRRWRRRWRAARRTPPPIPSGLGRLVVGAGGLAVVALGWLLLRVPAASLVLVVAAPAFAAVHLGRDVRRTADLAGAACAAGAVVAAILAAALSVAARLPDPGVAIAWIAQSAAIHRDQQLVAVAGALALVPTIATLWLARGRKPAAARRQTSRIVGYGLLLLATSAGAAAVASPPLWRALASSWSRHLPPDFAASRLEAALDSCGALDPTAILFVSETLWLGNTSLGAASRLDDTAGCAEIAAEMPPSPTIAVDPHVVAARVDCLLEALAARTCTVRWLGHHAGTATATPVCLSTPLAGRSCPLDGRRFAVIDRDVAYLFDGDTRSTVAPAELPPRCPEGGLLAASGRTPWSALLGAAAAIASQPSAPRIALAIAEHRAPPPRVEVVLPFRSVVELRVDPPDPSFVEPLRRLSDRLRRCHQPAGDWPPPRLEAFHHVLLGAPAPTVFRTDGGVTAESAACVAAALAQVPAFDEVPVRLGVRIVTELPHVDITLAGEPAPEAKAAFDELARELTDRRDEIDGCYRAALLADPSLSGAFALSLHPEGDYVEVAATEPADDVVACLANVLRQARWPLAAPAGMTLAVALRLPE